MARFRQLFVRDGVTARFRRNRRGLLLPLVCGRRLRGSWRGVRRLCSRTFRRRSACVFFGGSRIRAFRFCIKRPVQGRIQHFMRRHRITHGHLSRKSMPGSVRSAQSRGKPYRGSAAKVVCRARRLNATQPVA